MAIIFPPRQGVRRLGALIARVYPKRELDVSFAHAREMLVFLGVTACGLLYCGADASAGAGGGHSTLPPAAPGAVEEQEEGRLTAASGDLPAPPAPTAPETLWTRPAAPVSWTVSLQRTGASSGKPDRHLPLQVRVVVVGREAVETVHFPDRVAEVYRAGGLIFDSEQGWDRALVRVGARWNGGTTAGFPGADSSGENPAQTDWAELAEFAWIRPQMARGSAEIGGRKFLLFADFQEFPKNGMLPGGGVGKGVGLGGGRSGVSFHLPGGAPLKPGMRVAAIEVGSKLPGYLQVGDLLHTYSFSSPSLSKLDLPAKIRGQLEAPARKSSARVPVSMVP